MTLTDLLIVLATLLSPLIAVQVSKHLAASNEARGRKEWIYKTLMATRAYTLAPAHVEALNRIALEFLPSVPKEKAVLDAWEQYLDHLGVKQDAGWGNRRVELMVDMLHSMGQSLGYRFNKTQIKNGIYAPIAHGEMESAQEAIRRMTVELLEGSRSLPIRAFDNPPRSEVAPPKDAPLS